MFEPDQEAEALARFDALTAGRGAEARPSGAAYVRTLATGSFERLAAAIASRDIDAVGRQLADDFELVHHPTGSSYGRRGMVATWRSLLRAKHFAYRPEVLATLGDSLVLHRHALSADGFTEERLAAAGLIEMEELVVSEVDEHGRFRHMELFASDRLGAAFAGLYERYAELLPDGPAREHATAMVRLVNAVVRTAQFRSHRGDCWTEPRVRGSPTARVASVVRSRRLPANDWRAVRSL